MLKGGSGWLCIVVGLYSVECSDRFANCFQSGGQYSGLRFIVVGVFRSQRSIYVVRSRVDRSYVVRIKIGGVDCFVGFIMFASCSFVITSELLGLRGDSRGSSAEALTDCAEAAVASCCLRGVL